MRFSLLPVIQKRARGPLYLVGGALRDICLGRKVIDLDLAYQAPTKSFAETIARALDGTLVILDDVTRVYRIVLHKPLSAAMPNMEAIAQIDIAQITGHDIQEDLKRRDFTCNAMALPLPQLDDIKKSLIDPRNGLRDIKNKIIRADDPSVFREDPLRLLRAFRLAAQLGFRIEPKTMAALRAHRKLVLRPAGERIRQELLQVLSNPDCHLWLKTMDEADILTNLFPRLEASRKCAKIYYGRGGVLRHTLDAVSRMDFLLANLSRLWLDLADKIIRHFEGRENWQAILRLGVLLHDIAKPATARRIKNRLRFFGHESKGAKLASDILKKLRFSGCEIETIAAYVRHHLRPGNLAANARISDKAIFRFFKDLGANGVGLLLICWADHASYLTQPKLEGVLKYLCEDPCTFPKTKIKPDVRKTLHHMQVIHFLLHSFFNRQERVLPPKLLDGHDIMKILGLSPGPKVGKIIARLQEAQAEGKVLDKNTAVQFLRKIKR